MKIVHIALFFIAAGAIIFFVSRQKVTMVKDDSVLIVGTSPDYPPYEFLDPQTGMVLGFDIDVVSEVAIRLGKKLIILEKPFASLIFGLLSGEIDLIAAGMSPTPRRSKFVLFTQKYLDNDAYVILTIKNKFQPTGLGELKGKRVVVNTGYTAEAFIDSQNIGASVIRLKSPSDAIVGLKSGTADAFVCVQSTAVSMIKKINNSDMFSMFELQGTGDDCAFALNKKSEKLANEINQALDSMHSDGTLDNIKQKWKN